jgi:hypothetical protein
MNRKGIFVIESFLETEKQWVPTHTDINGLKVLCVLGTMNEAKEGLQREEAKQAIWKYRITRYSSTRKIRNISKAGRQ